MFMRASVCSIPFSESLNTSSFPSTIKSSPFELVKWNSWMEPEREVSFFQLRAPNSVWMFNSSSSSSFEIPRIFIICAFKSMTWLFCKNAKPSMVPEASPWYLFLFNSKALRSSCQPNWSSKTIKSTSSNSPKRTSNMRDFPSVVFSSKPLLFVGFFHHADQLSSPISHQSWGVPKMSLHAELLSNTVLVPRSTTNAGFDHTSTKLE